MVAAGQNLSVRLPLVGVVAVAPGQRRPQPPGGCGASTVQYPGHAPTCPPDGQPEPDSALFAAHERPQLVKFEGFGLLSLRFLGAADGAGGAMPEPLFLSD